MSGITPSISRKYPTNRDIGVRNGFYWLEGRKQDEEAEGIWRIHDNLYDLRDFVDSHPGGADWLKWTKGCDITESFESHHLTDKPRTVLAKYFVRKARAPRNLKFTFHEDGFYKTLQRRVAAALPTFDPQKKIQSKRIIEILYLLTLLFAILSVKFGSLAIGALAGVAMSWTVVSAHNFLHQKDNWRMYLWNISLMSHNETRIYHALSHHIYANMLHDLEISGWEPFLNWIPSDKLKPTDARKYLAWAISPLAYSLLFFKEFFVRMYATFVLQQYKFQPLEFVPALTVPLAMFVFGRPDLALVLKMWLYVLLCGSFYFAFIALNGAHHHTDMVHEGDALSKDSDWGIFQLDTICERSTFQGPLLFRISHYGDHSLHHLFPTVDQAYFPDIEPIFLQTVKEFDAAVVREYSAWELIVGQFKQLLRTTVNPVPVGERKKRN